jgi:uncharacterized membrane protein
MLTKLVQKPGLVLAVSSAGIFFSICFLLTLHRYYSFNATYDQGIFNQLFWNSIQGRFFESSLSSGLSTNVVHSKEFPEVFYRHLGQHFNPIFFLFMPLYALFPSNETLIFIQIALVTAAGLVLYALARHHLQTMLAGMITISFYCASCVNGPTLANFHDISSAPLLLFSVLLAMEKGWWKLFWVFALLLLGVRQDVGIALFSIGCYMILSKRFPKMGIAVCIVSIAYILLVTQQIMPLFSADVSKRMTIERFGHFATSSEASSTEIILDIIKNPFRLIAEIFYNFPSKLGYLVVHWLPLALVPAISPASWLAAGFPLLYLFLQRSGSALVISIRYAMPVVPGIFYGAIIWWSTRQELFQKAKIQRLWKICLSLSLVISFLANPNGTFSFVLPDSLKPIVYISLLSQSHHINEFKSLLDKITPSATVAATTQLIPQLSSRRGIVRLPELQLKNDAKEIIKVDYAIADLWRLEKFQVAFKEDRLLLRNIVKLVEEVTAKNEYGIVNFADGVILLQKSAPSDQKAIAAWTQYRQDLQEIMESG